MSVSITQVQFDIALVAGPTISFRLPVGAEVSDDEHAYDDAAQAFFEEFHSSFPVDHVTRTTTATDPGSGPFWEPGP